MRHSARKVRHQMLFSSTVQSATSSVVPWSEIKYKCIVSCRQHRATTIYIVTCSQQISTPFYIVNGSQHIIMFGGIVNGTLHVNLRGIINGS